MAFINETRIKVEFDSNSHSTLFDKLDDNSNEEMSYETLLANYNMITLEYKKFKEKYAA